MENFLIENNISLDENNKILIPSYAKKIKLDIGLCFHAPMSQQWLEIDNDLFVFGFEPNPFAIEQIRKGPNEELVPKNIGTFTFNTDKYLDKRFYLVPCALGNNCGILDLYMTEPNTGCSSIYKPSENPVFTYGQHVSNIVKVPIHTLASFFGCFPFDKYKLIDYIKIDAQGSDLDIIKGGGDFIKNHVICLTAEPENCQYLNTTNSLTDICDYMAEIGFSRIEHPNTTDPTFVNTKFADKFDGNIFQN